MLDNTVSITDGVDVITLNRINQDGYTGNFFGKSADGNSAYLLEVKHQLPKSSSGVEQHLVKLNKDVYSTIDGVRTLVSTYSAHLVLKTSVGAQVNADILALQNALEGLTDDTFIGKILDRRS